MATDAPTPAEALERIAYLLERTRQPTYRVRAFRSAAATVRKLSDDEVRDRAAQNRLRELPGIGDTTAQVIAEAAAGQVPAYLARLEAEAPAEDAPSPFAAAGAELQAKLKGDCHSHSDWSDGGSPILEMATTARDLGHEYLVLTDHSPRLTVAHGLDADRLRRQLEVVAEVNEELAPFRLLTGIEVDILADGALDQEEELLAELDVVVASAHSKLRMEPVEMTRRMVAAIASPHVDILGHLTGRLVMGRGRPESEFDADVVFAACARFDTAVEINCRPERLDPPRRLLRAAVEQGCKFAIDTDAHAPGQLEWQPYGCVRAVECEVPLESVVNAWSADDLLAWAGTHSA